MPTIAAALAAELGSVTRPGDFFVFGSTDILTPSLSVDGVGPIALPLLPAQAEQLVAVAERAPYGRGEATLVDPAVRRTWQIAPEHVHLGGRSWADSLSGIVARAAQGLGVGDPVEASFYKLLIYDAGSFFVSHRDTEKLPGMFATLVLVLPSVSTGGALVVRHRGREARLDLAEGEPSELVFAAFYADCVHEVLPVTSGNRLVLVYNLVRRGAGLMPEPPSYVSQQARIAALLRAWSEEQPAAAADGEEADDEEIDDLDDLEEAPAAERPAGPPLKLVYLLEHAYTPAELSFPALKGVDAAVAPVVAAAAHEARCELHLALVSVEESGIAEYTGSYRRHGRWSDEEEFEAGEVCERRVTAADWRRPDGQASPLTELPVQGGELSPPGAFDELEPDEEHFHEATGNEGASFERTYRRAALVLWPAAWLPRVINQAGEAVTLPYLADLAERWSARGADQSAPDWQLAHKLAGEMVATWQGPPAYATDRGEAGTATRMLALLGRLGDLARLDGFLAGPVAAGAFDRGDVPAVIEALGLLPPARAAALIERVVRGASDRRLGACAGLLARAAVEPVWRAAGLGPAAEALADALPTVPEPSRWDRRPGVAPGLITGVMTALEPIDARLALRTADRLLGLPAIYPLDGVLVPALRELLRGGRPVGEAVGRLRAAVLAHLEARAAEPLAPPTDWRRPAMLRCTCPQCRDLGTFLADPVQRTWVLKAAQGGRDHVEQSIRAASCDLDVRTEKTGRPYSLVCTKNSASYEGRVRQRRQDLLDLELLRAAAG